MANMAAAATLEALRERIRVLEGGSRVHRARLLTGVSEVDQLTRGLPRPGLVEASGREGAGATRLVAAIVAATTKSHRVAWVDVDRSLYPPALVELGVDLARLLVVRPPADGARAEEWAMEQLLRSGCFPLVVCSGAPRVSRAGGHRWGLAAEHGRCTGLVVARHPQRDLPVELRLQVGDGDRGGAWVSVARDRDGGSGRGLPLGALPEGADPWC